MIVEYEALNRKQKEDILKFVEESEVNPGLNLLIPAILIIYV